MNIINFSASEIPSKSANSVQVMKMSEALAKKGNKIKIFSKKPRIDLNAYDFYNVDEKVSNNISFEYTIWPSYRGIGGLLYGFINSCKFKKFSDYKIQYGRDVYSLFFSKHKAPIFYESHMIPNNKFKYMIEKKLFSNKNFFKLIVTSQTLKKGYLKLYKYLNNEKVVVLNNGAKKKHISLGEFKNYDNQFGSNIGYIGSLKEGKGINFLIKIASKLKNNNFHIIGGNEEEVINLEEQINNMNLKNIKLHGYITQENLIDIYEKLDILLAPYNDKYISYKGVKVPKYPSPLKIIEYFSYGKPIIASDIESCREYIDNYHNGILCENKPKIWVNAIDELSNNTELSYNIARNALKSFNNKYAWERRADKFIDLINN